LFQELHAPAATAAIAAAAAAQGIIMDLNVKQTFGLILSYPCKISLSNQIIYITSQIKEMVHLLLDCLFNTSKLALEPE